MKTVKGFSKIVAMVGAVALGLTLSACGNTNSASNTDSKNSGNHFVRRSRYLCDRRASCQKTSDQKLCCGYRIPSEGL